METFIQNIFNALQWGSFYALIALGYTLVYGVLLLINFAHGDIFMVGAYISFFVASILLGQIGGFFELSGPMALALTVPLTMVLTAGVGVTLERVAYRPLRRKGAHRLYVVITALMCGIMLENGNLALLGASRKALPEMIDKVVYTIGTVSVTNLKLMVIVTAFLVFALLQFIVTRTRIGMAMRAVAWDKFALPLMGIPLDSIIVFTFVLGSGFAGLAGLLFAMSYPILDPYMGAMVGWKAFIAAVVGGIGDIRGAFIGGFLLAFIEIMVAAVFPSTFRDLFAFSILLFIMWQRPTGLFGVAKTTKI
ncbi:branched-chain amino acid ABC transporter permease [Nitratidesulfovibrio vulgaris]|uniref:High-affinity branched-chain amino acid ABC ransporter, permease protein n=2 Tax=Nitratidesulfovibrio vulgaris TaxID=881 RepID=Q727W1_NITV2|nr:branched-chain amino acid ABC transporter permease [Nitratidesulfovibrio vulgaris]GEB79653.1 branched-chain amino acid ABC transporter permease [Desulfovibrio desulfuricans]HBW16212.1 branched-chain amino acid ABC transporter permease [Desulfovibrio sp.]AAS97215.1 high-affinity branched-chain amino acid ABC ransporter, permease protein [Nitratidesulfovibrio vulgaris str. Hildenborough]ABM27586.1 amino acid/amide ABC transporter membrane protein 1, HAAT family [Nitratidesulfovibrio vulgaris D